MCTLSEPFIHTFINTCLPRLTVGAQRAGPTAGFPSAVSPVWTPELDAWRNPANMCCMDEDLGSTPRLPVPTPVHSASRLTNGR